MVMDQEGYLWLGIDWSGIDRINPRTQEIEHFKIQPSAENTSTSIFQIHYAIDSSIYLVGRNILFRKKRTETDFTQILHSKTNFVKIIESTLGDIFLLTQTSLLRYDFEKNDFKEELLSNTKYLNALIDNINRLWIIETNGISSWKLNDSKWNRSSFMEYPFEDGDYFFKPSIYETHNGHLWIDGKEKLLKIYLKTNHLEKL